MARRDIEPPLTFDIWKRLEVKAVERATARSQAVTLERKIRGARNKWSNWTGNRQTLYEIGSLIRCRYLGPCDTDDGEIYLRAALPWIVAKAGGFSPNELEQHVISWCRAAAPRLDAGTICNCIAEAKERDGRQRLWWSAQKLGDLLRLTTDERERLRITRIRPAGMTVRQFKAYQRTRKAEMAKARRIAKGTRPREQSKAQLQPWDALGMSRATYFRRQKANTLPAQIRDRETISSIAGTKYLQPATGESHVTRQAAPGPARKPRPNLNVGADGHSPKAETKAVPLGRAVALPLPVDGVSENPYLSGASLDGGEWNQLGALLADYDGGVLPPDLVRAVRGVLEVRLITQNALASQIGASPPQLSNALQGRVGLGRVAAANLRSWLAALIPS